METDSLEVSFNRILFLIGRFPLKFLILSFCLFLSTFSYAGHEGNGGENAEAFFIAKGRHILETLVSSETGKKFLQKHSLDFWTLSQTLDASQIEVVDGPLIDVFGHEVAAIGEKNKILLSRPHWEKYETTGVEVDKLVFHEMLRSADIDDDDYKISLLILPLQQFSSFEDRFRLSNLIRPHQVLISLDQNHYQGTPTAIQVNDVSRTVAVEIPSQVLENGDHLQLRVKFSLTGFNNVRLVLREVQYFFNGKLNGFTKVQFQRSIYYDFFIKNGFYPPFQRSQHPIKSVNGNDFSFSDTLELHTATAENLYFDAQLAVDGPYEAQLELEKMVFYFDIIR